MQKIQGPDKEKDRKFIYDDMETGFALSDCVKR
jgi:hypothetical protein